MKKIRVFEYTLIRVRKKRKYVLRCRELSGSKRMDILKKINA